MTTGQILNMIAIILGLTGAIYGLFSILIRVIKKSVRDEIHSMEDEIVNRIGGIKSHATRR